MCDLSFAAICRHQRCKQRSVCAVSGGVAAAATTTTPATTAVITTTAAAAVSTAAGSDEVSTDTEKAAHRKHLRPFN